MIVLIVSKEWKSVKYLQFKDPVFYTLLAPLMEEAS